MIEGHFLVKIVQAHDAEETLRRLSAERFDLVLVNRKLDEDYSDGVEIIRQIKARPETADTPVMLVSNYAEHQQIAVEAGAVSGFGKLELGNPKTVEKLAPYLS